MDRPLLEPARIEAARRAQQEFGLCDACLGRRFAKVETGLTNAQRGAILRDALGAAPIEPARCFLCEGLLGELDTLADVARQAIAPYDVRHFLVGTRVDPTLEARESEVNLSLGLTEGFERIQSELNRETGKRVSLATGIAVEFKQPDLTAIIDTRFLDAELQFGGLCVYGRYQKLARDIPQTKWPCRRCQGRGCVRCGLTGKQYATSVEELVAIPFMAATGATDESFHGAGREDIDARAIGTGRPFILELKDPRRRALDFPSLAAEVAQVSEGRVAITDLRLAEKAEIAAIKEHRGEKTYRATVSLDAPVGAEKLREVAASLVGVTIEQRTPERVAHRRADLVRERKVLDLVIEHHEGAHAVLRIRGDAGLYIKELVSSDEGRTTPSLAGLLGVAARVTELDIIDVQG